MLCFNGHRTSLASLAGALTVIAVASVSSTQPAAAAGCGGYVNVFVSGCAPWDNNARRMPGAPGYQAPRPTTQPTLVGRVPQPPVQQRPLVTPTGQNRLITDNGAGLLANDGTSMRARGNILSDQGGGFRR